MDRPIRLDFIIASPFPYHRGGREMWLSHVARRLGADPGFCVRIWAAAGRKTGQPLDYGQAQGVELKTVRTLSSLPALHRALRPVLGRNRALVDWYRFCGAVAAQHRSLSSAERPDVIATVGSVSEALAGYWIRKLRPTAPAYVCLVRGRATRDTAPHYGALGRVLLGWETDAFRAADLILANGRETVDYVRERGFEAQFQPNGVDFAKFSSGQDQPQGDSAEIMGDPRLRYLLSTCTVGDSREIRGVAWRLRAVPILRRIWGEDFRLVFIGAGDGRQYADLVARLEIGDLVRFCGQRQEVPAFLARADVVTCLVTQGAGLSHSCLEAMAAGRPIIATDSDIYRQLLSHEQTALLVPANDDEALARALAELLTDHDLASRLGQAAQEAARAYDWSSVVRAFTDHIGLALERRRLATG